MSIKNVLKMGSVAVATLGLSTCTDNGAVDPAPEPFECPTSGTGDLITATSELTQDGLVKVSIGYAGPSIASWKSAPTVKDVTGAAVTSSGFDGTDQTFFRLVLEPSQGGTTGKFTISGTLTGDSVDCAVERVFTFSITGQSVTVALRDDLPLGSKARASIEIERHEGHEIHLTATGAVQGATLGWTATGGTVVAKDDGRAHWQLPKEPGLYQVELLVDRGREGLHIDTLTLEVT